MRPLEGGNVGFGYVRPDPVVHGKFTLSHTAYAVFVGTPATWRDERDAVRSIAKAAGVPVASVLRSLDYLIRLELVERRVTSSFPMVREIRKRP
jgi:ABC-type taurine transport system substrate-binding protein